MKAKQVQIKGGMKLCKKCGESLFVGWFAMLVSGKHYCHRCYEDMEAAK